MNGALLCGVFEEPPWPKQLADWRCTQFRLGNLHAMTGRMRKKKLCRGDSVLHQYTNVPHVVSLQLHVKQTLMLNNLRAVEKYLMTQRWKT